MARDPRRRLRRSGRRSCRRRRDDARRPGYGLGGPVLVPRVHHDPERPADIGRRESTDGRAELVLCGLCEPGAQGVVAALIALVDAGGAGCVAALPDIDERHVLARPRSRSGCEGLPRNGGADDPRSGQTRRRRCSVTRAKNDACSSGACDRHSGQRERGEAEDTLAAAVTHGPSVIGGLRGPLTPRMVIRPSPDGRLRGGGQLHTCETTVRRSKGSRACRSKGTAGDAPDRGGGVYRDLQKAPRQAPRRRWDDVRSNPPETVGGGGRDADRGAGGA